MKLKILYLLIAILAAGLALFFALLPQNQSSKAWRTARSLLETDGEYSSDQYALGDRPVIIPVKRPAKSAKEDPLDRKPHIPLELESWLRALRRQMIGKVEAQMRRILAENPAQTPPGKKVRGIGRNSPQVAEETEPGDYPFLLWRELQLCGDNSLVVNMLLVNNRREGQSRGVIVSQIIPEGWNLSTAWPEIQACDPVRREVKWLFAEAASRRDWILQVVLTPDEHAEIPLLPEENTTVRCCLPSGNLAQYACRSLP